MRKVTRSLLQAIGVNKVHEASDGHAGLEAIRTFGPDVVILDWEMPSLNGPDFVRAVRSPQTFPVPDVPIIMLTGFGERSRVVEAVDLGVNDFLLKPVSTKALKGRLISLVINPRRMVKKGDYYGPEPRQLSSYMPESDLDLGTRCQTDMGVAAERLRVNGNAHHVSRARPRGLRQTAPPSFTNPQGARGLMRCASLLAFDPSRPVSSCHRPKPSKKDLADRIQALCVLVVDDNQYMRKMIRNLLVNCGVKDIYEAADGIAALDAIRTVGPDVVILDWEMPLLNGAELVRIVRSPGVFPMPDVPIIMLSGHGERWRVVEAVRLGVNEYLIKPVSAKAIYDRLVSITLQPRPTVQLGDYYGPEPRKLATDAIETSMRARRSCRTRWADLAVDRRLVDTACGLAFATNCAQADAGICGRPICVK